MLASFKHKFSTCRLQLLDPFGRNWFGTSLMKESSVIDKYNYQDKTEPVKICENISISLMDKENAQQLRSNSNYDNYIKNYESIALSNTTKNDSSIIGLAQISTNNTYFSDETRMYQYFEYLSTKFNQTLIYEPLPGLHWNYIARDITPDLIESISISNNLNSSSYMETNAEWIEFEKKCMKKAAKQAKKDSKAYLRALDKLNAKNIIRLDWENLIESSDLYKECLERLNTLYKNDISFNKDINSTCNHYLTSYLNCNRRRSPSTKSLLKNIEVNNDDHDDDNFDKDKLNEYRLYFCKNYFLEELATYCALPKLLHSLSLSHSHSNSKCCKIMAIYHKHSQICEKFFSGCYNDQVINEMIKNNLIFFVLQVD